MFIGYVNSFIQEEQCGFIITAEGKRVIFHQKGFRTLSNMGKVTRVLT
jgi:hypothetical protein